MGHMNLCGAIIHDVQVARVHTSFFSAQGLIKRSITLTYGTKFNHIHGIHAIFMRFT